MNHEQVSQICFETTYTVPMAQTARAMFSQLPHALSYADTLVECLATGYLVAVVESMCIQELQDQIDPKAEVVVGRSMKLAHCVPAPPGTQLRVTGWVERLGQRSVTFCVRAYDKDQELVCDGLLTLVVADRVAMERRIASKSWGVAARPSGRDKTQAQLYWLSPRQSQSPEQMASA